MTKPHDERFNTPPPLEAMDPKDYTKAKKPGMDGFLEAFLADTEIKFVDKVEKA